MNKDDRDRKGRAISSRCRSFGSITGIDGSGSDSSFEVCGWKIRHFRTSFAILPSGLRNLGSRVDAERSEDFLLGRNDLGYQNSQEIFCGGRIGEGVCRSLRSELNRRKFKGREVGRFRKEL